MAEVVLNIAFALYVGASWLRSELWLRVVLMASSTCSTLVGILIASPSMVAWNAAFVVVMGARVARVWAQQRAVELSGEEAWIRAAVFPGLSDVSFHRLWQVGEDRVFAQSPLVAEGDVSDELMLVLSGAPVVRRQGETIATLWSGQFAGEMAFATNAPSNATVEPQDKPVRCRVWSASELRRLFADAPEIACGFEQAVSVDLISKLEAGQPRVSQR